MKENNMKKMIFKVSTVAFLTLLVNPLYGDAEHQHGDSCIQEKIGEAEAKEVALKEIKRLIAKKKLEASWGVVEVESASQHVFKSMPEWIVAFKNQKETNLERQHLYIFITQYAEITGVNFTGKH